MNHLVKILTDNSGEERRTPVWCVIQNINGNSTLCGGEYFGIGESGCVFEEKSVKRGGITCENCFKIVKRIKKIKF